MGGSSVEIEVKLRLPSADHARRRLAALGAREMRRRVFEDNLVYDLPSGTLEREGRLLRLRRAGNDAWLTYKEPAHDDLRHKVRREFETPIADPVALERILAALGFHVTYRYQKYRTVYRLEDLELAVDETPLGCFLELEGTPAAIERAARALGFAEGDYIRETYRDLHRTAIAQGTASPGDLVFPPDGRPV